MNTSLTFSASLVQKFWEAWEAGTYTGQRVGQAFYNHFNLHKVTSDKPALDRVYELDGQPARAWIANHTTVDS